jgi:hypothetical protein
MNKQKGFIGLGAIIAILVGIIVVGVVAYNLGKNKVEVPTTSTQPEISTTATNTVNEISPTLIFTSKLRNYSILYPKNWVVERNFSPDGELDVPAEYLSSTEYVGFKGVNDPDARFEIATWPSLDAIKKYLCSASTNVMINNYQACYRKYSAPSPAGDQPTTVVRYAFDHDGLIVDFEIFDPNKNSLQDFTSIINSIKFLK